VFDQHTDLIVSRSGFGLQQQQQQQHHQQLSLPQHLHQQQQHHQAHTQNHYPTRANIGYPIQEEEEEDDEEDEDDDQDDDQEDGIWDRFIERGPASRPSLVDPHNPKKPPQPYHSETVILVPFRAIHAPVEHDPFLLAVFPVGAGRRGVWALDAASIVEMGPGGAGGALLGSAVSGVRGGERGLGRGRGRGRGGGVDEKVVVEEVETPVVVVRGFEPSVLVGREEGEMAAGNTNRVIGLKDQVRLREGDHVVVSYVYLFFFFILFVLSTAYYIGRYLRMDGP
jgi:hypothetical protein